MGRVSQSLRARGTAEADQGEVWHDIGRKLSALQTRSPSMAMSMSDAYAARAPALDEYRDAFHPVNGQVGAAFGIDGRIAGVELFDAQATFATFLPKLVGSYALDALEADGNDGGPSQSLEMQVTTLLERARAAPSHEYRSIGEGTHVRLRDDHLAAGGLVARGRLVHLAAFLRRTRADRPPNDLPVH
jgi:hypothetical protein